MSEGFELRNKVPEQAFLKKEAEVVNGNPSDYYLCYSSEDRMVIALEQRQMILIDDFLLLKFYGKLAAVALESRNDFKKGFWYCPFGKTHRKEWLALYAQGVVSLPELVGTWIEIPRMVDNTEQLSSSFGEGTLLDIGRNYIGLAPKEKLSPQEAKIRRAGSFIEPISVDLF